MESFKLVILTDKIKLTDAKIDRLAICYKINGDRTQIATTIKVSFQEKLKQTDTMIELIKFHFC